MRKRTWRFVATRAVIAAWLMTFVWPQNARSHPYATEIVQAVGPFGPGPYGNTNAVLGGPATWFYDPFGGFNGGTTNRRVKLIEAAFNIAPYSTNLITSNLVVTLGAGSRIIVRFDQPVRDNPVNPYGIDLLVFGNSFYGSTGPVHDGADLTACMLTGGHFGEPLKISVSPGFTGQPGEDPDNPDTWPWFRYDAGPYCDTDFPTQAFVWDRATGSWTDELMDFTKPVNPALRIQLDAGGISAADAIDLYSGSGGGTGFDLRDSGFSEIRYVKVEGIDPGFSEGEMDAASAVRPMIVGDALSIAPGNVGTDFATLHFQQPGNEERTLVSLKFNEVSGVARVTTALLGDPAVLGPIDGETLNAVQLGIGPILAGPPISFDAALTLGIDENYEGDGSDLRVFKWDGIAWVAQTFAFDTTNRTALITNVTTMAAFAVTALVPPALAIHPNGAGYQVSFSPWAGWNHTVQRSTNLVTWTPLSAVMATNSLPLVIEDPAPPPGRAFYRLQLEQP